MLGVKLIKGCVNIVSHIFLWIVIIYIWILYRPVINDVLRIFMNQVWYNVHFYDIPDATFCAIKLKMNNNQIFEKRKRVVPVTPSRNEYVSDLKIICQVSFRK